MSSPLPHGQFGSLQASWPPQRPWLSGFHLASDLLRIKMRTLYVLGSNMSASFGSSPSSSPANAKVIHSNFLVTFDKVFLEHLQCPSQQPPGLCTWHTASTRPHWTGAGPWAWYTSSKRTWSRLMLSVSRRGGTWCSRVGLARRPQTPPLPSWSPSALPPPHRLSSRRLQRKGF